MNGFDISTISSVYVGNTQYNVIYYGGTKIWPSGSVTPPSPVHDYSLDYFTITSLDDNNEIQLMSENEYGYQTFSILASTDGGETWTEVLESYYGREIATLNEGESVIIKKGSEAWGAEDIQPYFASTGRYSVSGNIMSLIYGDNFTGQTQFLSGSTNVFQYMFHENSYLIDAQYLILPATTLVEGCYQGMFYYCASLTTAPELPATTLANYCYSQMFCACSALNYIKCLATDISATNSTVGWVSGVASSGTFVKDSTMTSWTTGDHGIPTNWTVMTVGSTGLQWSLSTYDYTLNNVFTAPTLTNPNNLTVTYSSSNTSVATIDSSTGTVTLQGTGTTTISAAFAGDSSFNAQTVSYTLTVSKATAGISWGSSTYSFATSSSDKPSFSNPNGLTVTFSSSDSAVATIDSSGNITYVGDGTCTLAATFSGNSIYNSSTVTCTLTLSSQQDYSQSYFTIESEANNNTITWKSSSSSNTKSISVSADGGTTWTSYTSNTTGVTIGTLNQGNKLLLKGTNKRYGTSQGARNVILGSADFKVYGNILSLQYEDNFASQTTLKNSDNYAFVGMFRDSTNLTNAENLILPATTVTNRSYMDMFRGCTALTAGPQLPATTVVKYAYQEMFRGCTHLTSIPTSLPATTLTEHCYDGMFRDCSALTTVPTISATTLDEYCCCDMFRDCANITTAPDLLAATLTTACYSQMFEGCIRLTRIRCLATDISASDCTTNWLRYTSDSGTFIKSSSNTSWSSDASGIPSGWTISSE